MEFYVFLWVADSDEVVTYSVAVVTLEHDLSVFVGSTASAKGFEFMRDFLEVAVLVVDAIDDGGWSSEFSGFKAYANSLLLFLNFAADTKVFG